MQTVSKKDVFEMYVNDELVFSRIQMGRYPTANVHLKCTLDSVGDSSRNWMWSVTRGQGEDRLSSSSNSPYPWWGYSKHASACVFWNQGEISWGHKRNGCACLLHWNGYGMCSVLPSICQQNNHIRQSLGFQSEGLPKQNTLCWNAHISVITSSMNVTLSCLYKEGRLLL